MKFSDIFVPRWQNSNSEIRMRAVKRLKDIKLLGQIAQNDDDPRVCEMAASQLERLQVKETIS